MLAIVTSYDHIRAALFFFNLASSVTRHHGQLSSCVTSEKPLYHTSVSLSDNADTEPPPPPSVPPPIHNEWGSTF